MSVYDTEKYYGRYGVLGYTELFMTFVECRVTMEDFCCCLSITFDPWACLEELSIRVTGSFP